MGRREGKDELEREAEEMMRPTHHVCFVCGEKFEVSKASECPRCGWLICVECGKCYCSLSKEAKRAVDALEETYCKHCPFER